MRSVSCITVYTAGARSLGQGAGMGNQRAVRALCASSTKRASSPADPRKNRWPGQAQSDEPKRRMQACACPCSPTSRSGECKPAPARWPRPPTCIPAAAALRVPERPTHGRGATGSRCANGVGRRRKRSDSAGLPSRPTPARCRRSRTAPARSQCAAAGRFASRRAPAGPAAADRRRAHRESLPAGQVGEEHWLQSTERFLDDPFNPALFGGLGLGALQQADDLFPARRGQRQICFERAWRLPQRVFQLFRAPSTCSRRMAAGMQARGGHLVLGG